MQFSGVPVRIEVRNLSINFLSCSSESAVCMPPGERAPEAFRWMMLDKKDGCSTDFTAPRSLKKVIGAARDDAKVTCPIRQAEPTP